LATVPAGCLDRPTHERPNSFLDDMESSQMSPQDSVQYAVSAHPATLHLPEPSTFKVEALAGDFARVRATGMSGADLALIYMRRNGDRWDVALMGVSFTEADLDQFGIPAEIRGTL
jgi:hypothetical protein